MTDYLKFYIDGQWVDNPEKIPVVDPATGSVMAEAAKAGQAEVIASVLESRQKQLKLSA